MINKKIKFSSMRRRFICAISLTTLSPSFLFAKEKNSFEYRATVRLTKNVIKEEINPNVFGICLMSPPFDALENELKKWTNRSVRIWARTDRKWWSRLLPALKQIAPETLLLFNDIAWHPKRIIYNGITATNLNTNQKPDAVIANMKMALSLLKTVNLEKKKLYWEAWNEPQFPQNGNWGPTAMARYVNDIALLAEKASLPFQVLAPLHMEPTQIGEDWNNQLCKELDLERVRGLVNHYYNVGWFNLEYPQDEFLRRAGDGPLLRERVRLNRALVDHYGKGNWTLHCSEWNVHPKNFKPPYYTSRDMAAALYAFSAIKVYLEEGLDSAQLFLLSGPNSHFATYTLENNIITARPTGIIMEWLGEKLSGELLGTEVNCPRFRRESEYGLPDFNVPYLEVIATRTKIETVVIISNKDPTRSVHVALEGIHGNRNNAELLTAQGKNKDIPVKTLVKVNGDLRIPPAAILAVSYKQNSF